MVKHQIDTGSHPAISRPPYRQSPARRKLTQELVKELLDLSIVRPSSSPWASPVVIVQKKTGDLRFCVDYRKLNEITRKDQYPLPHIQDSLDYLGEAKFFSSLDLKSGYYQIELNEENKPKTAFIKPDWLYELNVMPFGLTNAPATFQRCMDVVLSGLKYNSLLVYLDDILVYSSTFEEHLNRLEANFIRLQQVNLKLNHVKCTFILPKITYLGFVTDQNGQRPDPDKLLAIKDFPKPTNITGIRFFVSLCSYYRKFVKDFAKIAKPLTMLTKKEIPLLPTCVSFRNIFMIGLTNHFSE